jgi:Bifunctional DNA primase/polymerase, N-terminal
VKFLPLSKDNKPLVAYKDHPQLQHGLDAGQWVAEAMGQGYGIGVLLDNSGLVVIDTDSRVEFGRRSKEIFGWANFLEVCKGLGLDGIPHTFTVQTKTAGHYHFYFQQHPDFPLTRTSIHSQIPEVDVKVTGYVVSWHTKGYEIVREANIERMPRVLAERLYRAPSNNFGADSTGSTASYGQGGSYLTMTEDYADYLLEEVAHCANGERNAKLYRISKTFREAGLTTASARNRLMQAAVNAGLRETEAERTIESAWR